MSDRHCVFCDTQLVPGVRTRRGGEDHHFPTPRRFGGTETAPVCITCHDLADRCNLDDWPIVMALDAAAGLWTKLNRDERLLLWHMHTVVLRVLAERKDADSQCP